MAELKKITNQPVKYVINTHYHADHSGGNAKLQQLGAQVVASQQARDKMVEGKQPGMPNMTFDTTPALSSAASASSSITSVAPTPTATSSCCSQSIACWRRATCSRSATPRRS